MNYELLKSVIAETIKANGNNEITGPLLQSVLLTAVNTLGEGYQFAGVASQATMPGNSDAKLFYIAGGEGTYPNFNGLVVEEGEVAVFLRPVGYSSWIKQSFILDAGIGTEGALLYGSGVYGSLPSTPTDGRKYFLFKDKVSSGEKDRELYISSPDYQDGEWTLYGTFIRVKLATGETSAAGIMPILLSEQRIQEMLNSKANKDGWYSTLIAGGAENLIGNDIVSSQFIRRKTGGTADVGTGVAILKTIKGNTLVWNQLLDKSLLGAGGTINDVIFTTDLVAGTITAVGLSSASASYFGTNKQIQVISGHKYLLRGCPAGGGGSTWRLGFFKTGVIVCFDAGSGAIATASATDTVDWVYPQIMAAGLNVNLIFKPIIFDLTQMFGAGNEPSSVAEFEAMFPLSYYAYDSGSLLNLTATGIKTIGFNQLKMAGRTEYTGSSLAPTSAIAFDESKYYNGITANGYYNATANHHTNLNIGEGSIGGTCVTANYGVGFPVKALPNMTYYIKGTARIGFYDSEGWFIDSVAKTDATFTTPANCAWCLVVFGFTAGAYSYSGLNLSWSGYRDGEYEKYWESVLDLPITTLTSGGNAIFPEGMKSAGNAFDELTSTKAVKRIGKVDLGTLTWSYSSAKGFNARITEMKPQQAGMALNVVCPNYVGLNVNYSTWSASDKALYLIPRSISARYADYIFIKDSAYTDAATFKAAMSGVYLYYELDTPTEYTLDTPLNLQYRVDNDGTETILPENTSTPTTSPIVADINYALNAIDTIRNLPQNYISKASMDAILTAFKTAGVITNYTLTWDATNQKYNCTITA